MAPRDHSRDQHLLWNQPSDGALFCNQELIETPPQRNRFNSAPSPQTYEGTGTIAEGLIVIIANASNPGGVLQLEYLFDWA